jgi:hypothetical protein
MNDDFPSRVGKISADLLPGTVRQRNAGENYYVFEMIDNQGANTILPPIWLNPDATDQQIREKLARTLEELLHPETMPDDASVPTLKTEGRR